MSRKAPPVPPTDALKARFGENLVRCRKAADVSQEELGLRASLHRTEISLLERGERMPRVDTAVRIAGSLGVRLDDLVVGLEWKPGYEVVVRGGWGSIAAAGQNGDSPGPSTDGSVPTTTPSEH